MPGLKIKGPLNTTPSLEAVEGYRYAQILNIVFGGMINVFLTNPLQQVALRTSWSVSVMIQV